MKYGTRTGNPAKARTQCAIVGVYENGQLSPSARVLDKASKGYLRKILKRDDISGKANQTLLLHDVPNVGATRVLLVGLGNEKSMNSAEVCGHSKNCHRQDEGYLISNQLMLPA